jgi:cytoskeletal protein CcmA (bactofilin family)
MKTKFLIILMLLSALTLSAIDFEFSGGTFTEDSMELNDYVFAGEKLIFNGKADNVYFAGKELVFQGEAESGLTAAGEIITVDGTVKNDVHLGAKNIYIQGDIEGSVFAAGSDIVVDSTLTGDLISAGMKVTINGVVNGDVYAGAGKVVIEGVVNGNLYAQTGKIVFGENGRIEGNVEYSSEWELLDNEKAKVKGILLYKKWEKPYCFDSDKIIRDFGWIWPVMKIIFILSFIVAGVLLLVFPASRTLEKERTKKQILYTFLWGLIPFFVYPVAVLMTFLLGIIFGITVPIAIVLLFAALPFLAFAQVLGVTLFGQFMFNVFKWEKTNRHLFFLFGMLFAAVISFIPVLSILGFIFFAAVGWGRILESIFKVEFGKEKEAEA